MDTDRKMRIILPNAEETQGLHRRRLPGIHLRNTGMPLSASFFKSNVMHTSYLLLIIILFTSNPITCNSSQSKELTAAKPPPLEYTTKDQISIERQLDEKEAVRRLAKKDIDSVGNENMDDEDHIGKVKDHPYGGSFSDSDSDRGFWDQINEMKFFHAFLASFCVIMVSEIGDKTFFIAAILAMRNSRLTVYLAAISALIIMTILAVLLGVASSIIPKTITHFGSILLFAGFGLKLIYEGWQMTEEEANEEYEEVQKSLSKKDVSSLDYSVHNGLLTTEDPETGVIIVASSAVPWSTKLKRKCMQFVSLIFIETFTMTFLAEWGDRSQISTIILAAREDVWGVTIGSLLGHSICTGIAVLGGRMVAQLISVRQVTLIGGLVFISFALFALLMGED